MASARRSSRTRWNDCEQRPAGEHSEQTAADKRHEELFQPGTDVQLTSGSDHSEQDGEERDRGRIVEESLALDQAGQARRCADVTKDRDDRSGVGGRHHRAEQQTDHQRDPPKRPKRQTDDRGGNQRGNDREQQDRRRIFQHPPDVGGDAGLEHEQGQKDIDKGAGADREVDEDFGKCICFAGPAQMRHQGRKPSQGQANHAEQDRRRQLQISRQWLTQTDHDQQSSNDDQYKSDVGHRRRELLNPEKQGRSDALLRIWILPSVEPPGHRNRETLLDSRFSSRPQQPRFDLIFYCAAAELLG